MKLKISESQIRTIVNEEVLKQTLNKTVKEQKWPSYAAYLLAEILMLEYSKEVEATGKEMNMDDQELAEWVDKNAKNYDLPASDVQEAKEILGQSKGAGQPATGEGAGGFLKAFAAPYKNIWQAYANVTQSMVNATDPAMKKQAPAAAQAAEVIPEPEEVVQQAKADPGGTDELLRKILALLQKADQAVELPGDMEKKIDTAVDGLGDAAEDLGAEAPAGGEEGAGGEVFVFKGKGGKGLQSFLAKGGVKGPVMGAVLKHIEKQLKAQGVTVSEGVLDEVQGWMWYGLAEDAYRAEHGQKALNELLDTQMADSAKADRRSARNKAGAAGDVEKGDSFSYTSKKGAKSAVQVVEPDPNPSKPDLVALNKIDPETCEPKPNGDFAGNKNNLGAPIDSCSVGGGDEAGGEEAPIEEVPPTVQNTAPEDAPLVKVFKGKGGDGLQSALARSRDKLGIDQRTVSVIIKSVEKWAQANQIRVENISEDTFDSIINEIVPKYRARRLQEKINKLK